MSLEMLIRQLIAGLQDASDEGLEKEKPNVYNKTFISFNRDACTVIIPRFNSPQRCPTK